MENFDDAKLIAYFRNELNPEEMQKIQDRLANDEIFAKEFKIQQLLFEHIELLEDRKIANIVGEVHQQELARRKQRPLFGLTRQQWMGIAAGLAILLTAAWLLFPSSQLSTDSLVAQNFAPYELSFGQRSEGDETIKAGLAYQNGNYKEAVALFEALVAADDSRAKERLALGISQMHCKKWQAAKDNFQLLIDAQDFLYADKARWYMGLTLLKLDELGAAKAQFEILANDAKATFHAQAKTILKEIE